MSLPTSTQSLYQCVIIYQLSKYDNSSFWFVILSYIVYFYKKNHWNHTEFARTSRINFMRKRGGDRTQSLVEVIVSYRTVLAGPVWKKNYKDYRFDFSERWNLKKPFKSSNLQHDNVNQLWHERILVEEPNLLTSLYL